MNIPARNSFAQYRNISTRCSKTGIGPPAIRAASPPPSRGQKYSTISYRNSCGKYWNSSVGHRSSTVLTGNTKLTKEQRLAAGVVLLFYRLLFPTFSPRYYLDREILLQIYITLQYVIFYIALSYILKRQYCKS
jgi:hypothetical protein